MDRETRNRIQRATQAARELLEHEYGEQLEGVFDIHLDGTVEAEPGEHLDAAQRVLRTKLVTAVEHQRASGMTKADAVASYLREAAFTTLNRFVALKMLEARNLVQECISRGDQSAGFKEFTGLAPGLVQLPDHGYRIYIESLFDEVGQEVRVLFDRRDPASLLWPRRQGLLDLLGILDTPDLASVWSEDETIGWVYQYFNSDDERKQMRAESQAPRNSRELAVRNQFFTPRYVVQFLTDNTLGRIWYEMRRGETRLGDLDYLVRRPNEIFLAEGEEAPGGEAEPKKSVIESQVYVPFRHKKDPRDIRVLDPACGSGHFLLYAFDLFLTIYEEAWTDEASPRSEATGLQLREDYAGLAELRVALPSLILRHNLHGIDIDSRCAQIAALALWMRAQRSYHDSGISRNARPPILRVGLVTAEPLLGGEQRLEAFLSTLDAKLSTLMRRVLGQMSRAGDAGALLRIDAELARSIKDVYGEAGDLFRASDEQRWQRAEEEFNEALRLYCEHADADDSYGRRLFAEDAARGLAFIDASRQRYDVALMNPPFGEASPACDEIVRDRFPLGQHDLAAAFVLLGQKLADQVGVIATRSLMLMPAAAKWRASVQEDYSFSCVADFGGGVLDAFVETFAAVLKPRDGLPSVFFRCVDAIEKAPSLRTSVPRLRSGATPADVFVRGADDFRAIPLAPMAYWAPEDILHLFRNEPPYEPAAGAARTGLATLDNFRFLRCWWELPAESLQDAGWRLLAKGGDSWPFFWDNEQRLNWVDDGRELKCFVAKKVGSVSRKIQAVQFYGRPGISWIQRSQRGFCPRALPSGGIFDTKGPTAFPNDDGDLAPTLALFSSVLFQDLVDFQSSFGSYHPGVVQRSPAPRWDGRSKAALSSLALQAYEAARRLRVDETSVYFTEPSPARLIAAGRANDWVEAAAVAKAQMAEDSRQIIECLKLIEPAAHEAYGLAPSDDSARRHRQAAVRWAGVVEPLESPVLAQRFVLWALGGALGRWRATAHAQEPRMLGPFEHYPHVPPGMAEEARFHATVDDLGHDADLEGRVVAFVANWTGRDEQHARHVLAGALADLGGGSIREMSRSSSRTSLFDLHLQAYSASRRAAPIYWQLATSSRSYSVWITQYGLTADTLYRVLGDLVGPKLLHEERKLNALKQESGAAPAPSQSNAIASQQAFVDEIRTLRDDLARVAPLWRPVGQDGVLINACPLWRAFAHHSAWQKDCRATWENLCKGEYDWAHLAMYLWPERVVPKCAKDRSLAIAHGLEDVFWHEDSDGKWQPRKTDQAEVDKLIKERTSAAVKDALKSLLDAPAAETGRTRRRKAPRVKGTRKRAAPVRPKGATNGAPSRTGSSATAVPELLTRVKEVIAANGDGASKTDVIDATGISASEWNKAIKALLADGSVTQTGERRGALYHLAGGEA